MPRRLSCALTVDAVRERRKTVTRRHVGTWKALQFGDRLTLVEKGMGLRKGEPQVVLAEVEVVSVRAEVLWAGVTRSEIAAEGFDPDEWTPHDWCVWWAESHGYRPDLGPDEGLPTVQCRRIEWRYLEDKADTP